MRTCLAAVTIGGVLVLGVHSVAWGQSSNRSTTSSSSNRSTTSTSSNRSTTSTSSNRSTASTSSGSSGISTLSAQSTRGGSGRSAGVIQLAPTTQAQTGEFVGPDASAAREAMMATGLARDGGAGAGQAGRSGLSTLGSSSLSRTLQSLLGSGGSRLGGSSAANVPIRLRAAINAPRPAPAQVGSALAERLERSLRLPSRSPMAVTIEGQTAVLRGVVATEHDRRIAEQLARLEPGVRRVENLLTVGPAAASPSDQPATP